MSRKPRIVVVGEGMVELIATAHGTQLGYGGDTLNTAIHLARFGLATAFFSALGTDTFSRQLQAQWSSDGLDTSLILTDPERQPGLYAIHTDQHGERSFTYWREQSAARRMFELEGARQAMREAQQATLLYYSLISLAILPPKGREQLLQLAAQVRERGGLVAFDGNYRPRLWRSSSEARSMRDAAVQRCDTGLPSLDDEQQLSAARSADDVLAHWSSLGTNELGTREVVVKMGRAGALVDGHAIASPGPVEPVDTTGAGDAFNAGYLAARLRGQDPARAALLGHALAGWVVMRRGAIPPSDEDAPYRALST